MTDDRRVMAVGFFDGVHIGHAALLEKAKQKALEIGARPAVLSFDTHPDDLIFHQTVKLIGDSESRKDLIERCFVVGYDFTFGKDGEGNPEKLQLYCQQNGLECEIIDAVRLDGTVVSSTLIRSLIERGDIEEANRFLGHPYCLSGKVHSGFHIGRQMHAPTINMNFPDGVVIPRYGVYATKVVLKNGNEFMAATNIGVRPTFSTDGKVSAESYILHFSDDLYGKAVRVDFYGFIRPERKFADLQALSVQIQTDAAETEAYLMRNS